MNDLFMQYFQSFTSLLDLAKVPILPILINFSCATRPFLSKDCQTNAIWPFSKLFLSFFVFLAPYLEYKPVEGRKGPSRELV